MQTAEANVFTNTTRLRMMPPSVATAFITSGTPCPLASLAKRVDDRTDDRSPKGRTDQHIPPGQRCGHGSHVSRMTEDQALKERDQVSKEDCAKSSRKAHNYSQNGDYRVSVPAGES